MLPARIDPSLAIERTAMGTTWSCLDAPAGLFDTTAPAGSGSEGAVAAAIAWVKSAGPNREQFRATHAARRAIAPRNASMMTPICDALASSVGASQHGAACLDAVRTGLLHGWDAALACERAHLVKLRHTPEARAKLDAFLKR